MSNTENEKKENYMGKISWSKGHCGSPKNLFGTEIKTDHPISIEVREASVERSLSKDWYHSGPSIVHIELSPVQWAEFLTSGNSEGVPCTIVSRGREIMDAVPQLRNIEQFAKESVVAFEAFEQGAESLKSVVKDAIESGKPMGKKQLEELLRKIENYKDNTVSNLKFVRNSFQEDMEEIVAKAKAEVNAYVENKALELGMKDLKESVQLRIDDNKQ